MLHSSVQKLIDENKIKVLNKQESLDSTTFDVLDGVAQQLSEGKIKVSDIYFDSMGNNENECFIFTTFKFLE